MSDSTRVVTVEIHGHKYPIRSSLDPAYVAELAAFLDAKMRLAARETMSADSLKIAVVAALNIADEYFRARDGRGSADSQLRRRTEEIEQLVDQALAGR